MICVEWQSFDFIETCDRMGRGKRRKVGIGWENWMSLDDEVISQWCQFGNERGQQMEKTARGWKSCLKFSRFWKVDRSG